LSVAPCSFELFPVIQVESGSGGREEEEIIRGRGDSKGSVWVAGVGISSGGERIWKGLEDEEER